MRQSAMPAPAPWTRAAGSSEVGRDRIPAWTYCTGNGRYCAR